VPTDRKPPLSPATGEFGRRVRNLSLHNILRIAHALDTDAGGLVSGLAV